VQHAAFLAIGGYVLYRVYKFTHWKIKNHEVQQLARDTLEKRNAQWHKFNLDGIDVDLILKSDLKELRRGLMKGKFTSVDLVNVFGERSQRLGRLLNLSTEENF
jgi:hypothetical protein